MYVSATGLPMPSKILYVLTFDLLQGFAQIPDLTVWYGPDTYMGRNLAQLFTSLAEMPDEEVKKLHPQHTQASVKALLPRLHYFEEGTCIVHHIFGGEVTELVRKGYSDAFLTAHFEVGALTARFAASNCASGCAVWWACLWGLVVRGIRWYWVNERSCRSVVLVRSPSYVVLLLLLSNV